MTAASGAKVRHGMSSLQPSSGRGQRDSAWTRYLTQQQLHDCGIWCQSQARDVLFTADFRAWAEGLSLDPMPDAAVAA